jgi:hypothetical protein
MRRLPRTQVQSDEKESTRLWLSGTYGRKLGG